jgi:quercetin dioxygenase-like cupin family protein
MASGAAPLAPTFVRDDERGSFIEILRSGPWHTVITGSMRSGAVIGNHYHKRTRLFIFLTQGSARVEEIAVADGTRSTCELPAGEGIFLEPHHAHAIRFLAPSTFIMLKSRPYRDDDQDTYPYPVPSAD